MLPPPKKVLPQSLIVNRVAEDPLLNVRRKHLADFASIERSSSGDFHVLDCAIFPQVDDSRDAHTRIPWIDLPNKGSSHTGGPHIHLVAGLAQHLPFAQDFFRRKKGQQPLCQTAFVLSPTFELIRFWCDKGNPWRHWQW